MTQFVVVLVLIVLLILLVRHLVRRPRNESTADPIDIQYSARISDRDFKDGGATVEGVQDGVVFNPEGGFPVHLKGVGLSDVEPIIAAQREYASPIELKERLGLVITQRNAESPEVEAFLQEIGPRYYKALKALLDREPDHESWPAADREDFIQESREEALDAVELCCRYEDVLTLLHERPEDATADDDITRQFDGDPAGLRRYLRLCAMKKPYQAYDRDDRKLMEGLVERGLAIPGSEIPFEEILHMLRMKDIQRLLGDDAPRKFGRKADAVACALEVEGMRDRVAEEIPLRSLYKVADPTGDTAAAAAAFEYATEYAGLILTTILTDTRVRHDQKRDAGIVTRWEVTGDDCVLCQKHQGKTITSRAKAALPPHHIGCTCYLEPEF